MVSECMRNWQNINQGGNIIAKVERYTLTNGGDDKDWNSAIIHAPHMHISIIYMNILYVFEIVIAFMIEQYQSKGREGEVLI